MKKEQILENSYNTYFTDSKYQEYPDKNFTEIYVLPAMDDYSKQECIEYSKWIWETGFKELTAYTAQWISIHGHIEYDENTLYELYLQSKQK